MTRFIDARNSEDKGSVILSAVRSLRASETPENVFELDAREFSCIPTSAFAYWSSKPVRNAFLLLPKLQSGRRHACITNPAGDDNRYLRLWWEPHASVRSDVQWHPVAKGGKYSPYYADVHLVGAWNRSKNTYHGFIGTFHRPLEKLASVEHFFRPGITWPSRTERFGARLMPAGCIFTGKGPGCFDSENDPKSLLALCALMNSSPFQALLETRLNAGDAVARSYEVGLIQSTPVPSLAVEQGRELESLAHRLWSLGWLLDTFHESSHAFIGPELIRNRSNGFNRELILEEINKLQRRIDAIAFEAYGFSPDDCRLLVSRSFKEPGPHDEDVDGDSDVATSTEPPSGLQAAHLLSWVVGVAFGRFDWRWAKGDAEVPSAPEPLDRLPEISPGMRQKEIPPFHTHAGILVDDRSHLHDLARIVEELLSHLEIPFPGDVRRWIQRDFFSFHLQQYSKSRRKAPIYWPISISSGAFTLWVYWPTLTNQTLYSAINDFIEPKLAQVSSEVTALRDRALNRSRDDERKFEELQSFQVEMVELREALLKLAPTFKPNHDDGVQISAAPLWPLFRHKPWQKILKDTWSKLEKGDYDWSHLALNYWPDRVREKCKNDKSLAIAHGLEHVYVEPEAKPSKTRGRKKAGDTE